MDLKRFCTAYIPFTLEIAEFVYSSEICWKNKKAALEERLYLWLLDLI